MVRRPRMPDEIFELFEDKKESDKENIADVMLREFPELEKELEDRKKQEEKLFEDKDDNDLFDGGLLE